MYATIIDLTHDCLPEKEWKPVRHEPEKIPPLTIIKDNVLLRDWEQTLVNEWYSYVYDRRIIEIECLRKFITNGEIVKMAIDPRDLTRDKNFWKEEVAIQ